VQLHGSRFVRHSMPGSPECQPRGGRRQTAYRSSLLTDTSEGGRDADYATPRPRTGLCGPEYTSRRQRPGTHVFAWRQHPAIDARVLREPLHRPDCGPADSVSVVISAPGGPPRCTTSGTVAGASADTGQWPGWTGTESTFQPERCVVLMPYRLRSSTGGHRPLPGGSDTVPECRGGIRRWSG
jgi:hypothetical protein